MDFHILRIKTDKRRLGDLGERAAAKYLRRVGYKILEKNYVCDEGEIDIICKNKTTMVFVEVKTRTLGHLSPKEPRPASAVTPDKRRKIVLAAAPYGGLHGKGLRKRLDIIEVFVDDSTGKPKIAEIKHLEGAFDKSVLNERVYPG